MNISQMKIEDYLEVLSSAKTSIVGGSSSALSGANACSLALMVLSLTLGKKKYEEYEDNNIKIKNNLEKLKMQFLLCADDDAKSFEKMKYVYSMPNESDNDKKIRKNAMQNALKECMIVPEKILALSSEMLENINNLIGKSNVSARSDIGASASFIRNTIDTAILNIYINLASIEDKNYVEEHKILADILVKKNIELADSIFLEIKNSFIV